MGPYEYRCEKCALTSPQVYTRRELDDLRHEHRVRAHGGLIPDGEDVLRTERARLADLPGEQRVAAVVLLAAVLLVALVKLL
ncbi:hypothetical protein [Streptomyces sp. CA-253872]|uniref:hypothetical protein n=1 Tax=Streptomyces sp. CA-253872 TaxID=3240067 RepID=UPI003D8CF9A5